MQPVVAARAAALRRAARGAAGGPTPAPALRRSGATDSVTVSGWGGGGSGGWAWQHWCRGASAGALAAALHVAHSRSVAAAEEKQQG